jgi:hypothetical protein
MQDLISRGEPPVDTRRGPLGYPGHHDHAAHCAPPAFLDFVRLLVEKVIVSPNDLEVRLRANGIERLVLELRPEPVEQQEEALA